MIARAEAADAMTAYALSLDLFTRDPTPDNARRLVEASIWCADAIPAATREALGDGYELLERAVRRVKR